MENEKNIQKVIMATPLSEAAIARVVEGYDSISGNGTLSARGTPEGGIVRLNGAVIYQAPKMDGGDTR
jgi:hypothetical protein